MSEILDRRTSRGRTKALGDEQQDEKQWAEIGIWEGTSERWNKLSREVVEIPSLGIFRSHLDVLLINML